MEVFDRLHQQMFWVYCFAKPQSHSRVYPLYTRHDRRNDGTTPCRTFGLSVTNTLSLDEYRRTKKVFCPDRAIEYRITVVSIVLWGHVLSPERSTMQIAFPTRLLTPFPFASPNCFGVEPRFGKQPTLITIYKNHRNQKRIPQTIPGMLACRTATSTAAGSTNNYDIQYRTPSKNTR